MLHPLQCGEAGRNPCRCNSRNNCSHQSSRVTACLVPSVSETPLCVFASSSDVMTECQRLAENRLCRHSPSMRFGDQQLQTDAVARDIGPLNDRSRLQQSFNVPGFASAACRGAVAHFLPPLWCDRRASQPFCQSSCPQLEGEGRNLVCRVQVAMDDEPSQRDELRFWVLIAVLVAVLVFAVLLTPTFVAWWLAK